jgi:choline transporter-like protein 2/4/5
MSEPEHEKKPQEEEKKYEKPDPYEHYKKDKEGNPAKANPELMNGPMSDTNRGCTDIIFCLIFIVFLCAMLAVAGFGWWSGEPSKIMYFYDDDSRQCGLGVMANYKYLYLYSSVTELKKLNTATWSSRAFCVKTCPWNYRDVVQCFPTSLKTDCLVDFENLFLSEPFLERICLPSYNAYQQLNFTTPGAINPYLYPTASAAAIINTQISKQSNATSLFSSSFINTDQLLQYVADLVTTWPVIAASVGVAFIVCLIYMLFLRCCAGFICYLVIFLILLTLTVLGYIFQARTLLYTKESEKTTYIIIRVFSCTFYTLACIWLIFILANCNSIRLAIAITKVIL